MLQLNNVEYQYDNSDKGVHDISLTIHDGECVVLMGPSGGGKTTLIRLLNGLAPAYYDGNFSGEILLNDKPLNKMKTWEIGLEIGSVFQDPKSQFFSSDLAGEVAFACENYGLPQKEIQSRVHEAIDVFHLNKLCNKSLDVLSSGEKQRTAIASVFSLDPHTYICDEPTANLDETGTEDLANIFKDLKAMGKTIVIAEHRLWWLKEFADRFIYISKGRILWEKTSKELSAMSKEELIEFGLREFNKSQICTSLNTTEKDTLILKGQDISYERSKRKILEGVSIELHKGDILGLVGINGAGKTTLATILSGLSRQTKGKILINGNIVYPHTRRKYIWYSSNDTSTQFFTNSVTEELLIGLKRDDLTINKTRELLRKLGIYEFKDCHPASLSGGQKQRLSIACGILSGRPILILDEPTSGLDGRNMRTIAKILKQEAKRGKSILVISHDKEWINQCCTSIYKLKAKR